MSRCPAVKGEAGQPAAARAEAAAAAAAAGRSDGSVCCMLPESLRRSEAKGRGGLTERRASAESLPPDCTSHSARGEEETAGRWHSSSTQSPHQTTAGATGVRRCQKLTV